ncbi:MAG: hypothetical protein M3345_03140 [Actinomycetota bacterium]|nr:hypothetical protein [Actinomycetota bacterium]
MASRKLTAKLVWMGALSAFLTACSTGINAGGETATNNGGVAFIVMAATLVAIVVILWLILGRRE